MEGNVFLLLLLGLAVLLLVSLLLQDKKKPAPSVFSRPATVEEKMLKEKEKVPAGCKQENAVCYTDDECCSQVCLVDHPMTTSPPIGHCAPVRYEPSPGQTMVDLSYPFKEI
jgi:hypothetical protein